MLSSPASIIAMRALRGHGYAPAAQNKIRKGLAPIKEGREAESTSPSRSRPRDIGGAGWRFQFAGFQMMTLLVGSSPGAGATLPKMLPNSGAESETEM